RAGAARQQPPHPSARGVHGRDARDVRADLAALGAPAVPALGVGIVGARFAADLHAVNYRSLIPARVRLAAVCARTRADVEAVAKAGVTLCYAEDFVYAPPVAKLRRLLDVSGGAIMELRAEESHSGSHAAYARRWQTAGGGALLRMGSHPVGVVLHLKHYEGEQRTGRPIRARSVLADVAQLTKLPGIAGKTPHHRTAVEDVEDWSVALITFEDGTK